MDATRKFSLALHKNDDGLTIHLLKLSLVLSKLKKKSNQKSDDLPTNRRNFAQQPDVNVRECRDLFGGGDFLHPRLYFLFVSDPRTWVCITD